jgi:hypothetical protein
VRTLVGRFFAGFAAGNTSRLDALFAADDGDGDAGTPSFQWYSTDGPGRRLGRAAADRATLMPYFASRHRLGERLRLIWLSRGVNANGYFHFQFKLVRQARDLRPTRFDGKGAATCAGTRARIAVWSMARQAVA